MDLVLNNREVDPFEIFHELSIHQIVPNIPEDDAQDFIISRHIPFITFLERANELFNVPVDEFMNLETFNFNPNLFPDAIKENMII